jgi:protein MAK11
MASSSLDRIRIVVGSYDGWLYGWEKDDAPSPGASSGAPSASSSSSSSSASAAAAAAVSERPINLAIKYAYEPHVGVVKSAALMTAAGGEWLATGGADETIRVYNLRRRRDMGALHSHSGAVTALEFFGRAHLLSGSDDGTLRIWRVSDWACIHVLGGHKAGVTSIAIHPTGRLALSTSSDKTVRLWNLMEGRIAYISKLSALPTPEKVRFSRKGDHYALLFRNRVLAYDVATGDVVAELEHERTRLQDFAFVGGNRIVTSADDGMLRLWSIADEGTLLFETGCGMKDRIRAISLVQDDKDEDEDEDEASVTHLAIVFTSGLVQVWVYDPAVDVSDENTCGAVLTRLCSLTRVAKTGSRATCLASCFALRPGSKAALAAAKAKGNFGKIVTGGDGGDKSRGGIENKSFKAKAKKWKRKRQEESSEASGASAKRVSGGKLLHDYQERQKNKKNKKKNKKDEKDGAGKDGAGKKGGRNKNWKRDREMQWEKEEDERLHRKNNQQNAAKRGGGGGKKGKKKGGRR